jgi:hypothetical protein
MAQGERLCSPIAKGRRTFMANNEKDIDYGKMPEATDAMAAFSPEQLAAINALIESRVNAGVEEKLAKLKKTSKVDTAAPKDSAAENRQNIDDYLNERVEVKLFKDNDQYKDDVSIGWNGRPIRIQRGVTVRIPRGAYLILMQSLEQDEKTAMLIEQKALEFENEAKARKII